MRRATLPVMLALATAGCGAESDSLGTTTPDDAGFVDAPDAAIDDAAGGSYEDIDYSDTPWADWEPASGCPTGLPGPSMVFIPLEDGGGFCIDSTEVTRGQYAEFLAAGVEVGGGPEFCTYKHTYEPNNGYPVPDFTWPPNADGTDLPMNWIDHCDAAAFCRWAGKRLCGRVGGGGLTLEAINDPTLDQWYIACSAEGRQLFPYAGSPLDAPCATAVCAVTSEPSTCKPGSVVPVGSKPNCVGAYPDVFDMVGNVGEMIDACDRVTGGGYKCRSNGGGATTLPTLANCLYGAASPAQSIGPGPGFRCCGR
jgi:sulfatase modifying factor 1